jgi:hypothetical protein
MIKSLPTPSLVPESFSRFLTAVLAHPAPHIALGALILLVDLVTDRMLMFPILFVIPVATCAWNSSARVAYFLAFALPLIRFSLVVFVEGTPNLTAAIINALIRIALLVMVAYFVHRIVRQNREIKQLKGILPICMFCKSIRTPDDQWVQLETYISSHSEANFSHGFCPQCGKDHYGEFMKDS